MKEIRVIPASDVTEAVCKLFLKANSALPPDVEACVRQAPAKERDPLARSVLCRLADNLDAARQFDLPICQDTGMAIVFADVGEQVHIDGATLQEAVDAGVVRAYRDGALRCSIVTDPLFDRVNTTDNTPAVLHIRTVAGDRLTLTAAPKGFGSENMSAARMFTPAATPADIADFVVEAVRRAGSNPCPPITVGVGIGSDFEGVACLSKRALLVPMGVRHADKRYAELENTILARVNALGIGPQGFGGDTTAFDVHILTAPTHIAGLPCAVNINCHVNRHAVLTL